MNQVVVCPCFVYFENFNITGLTEYETAAWRYKS